jgi:hypothetical protein
MLSVILQEDWTLFIARFAMIAKDIVIAGASNIHQDINSDDDA